MDINTLRVAVTVVSFVTFIGIFLWAYSSGPRKAFVECSTGHIQNTDRKPSIGHQ